MKQYKFVIKCNNANDFKVYNKNRNIFTICKCIRLGAAIGRGTSSLPLLLLFLLLLTAFPLSFGTTRKNRPVPFLLII